MHRSPPFPFTVYDETDLQGIEASMLDVLEHVGIQVHSERLHAALRRARVPLSGDRARLPKSVVRAFLEQDRAQNRRSGSPAAVPSGRLPTLQVNDYIQNRHDPATDRIAPFTLETLAEATHLLDGLADRGVASSPPGLPSDVPAALQPVHQYWVAATCSRQGTLPVDPKTPAGFPEVREMSEALGSPLRSLGVWVVSPLLLGGESLDAVLDHVDALDRVEVGNMAGIGSTLPIHVGDAFAVSLAETIGSAALLREVLPPRVEISWHSGFNPTDFRSGAMVLGSPEFLLLCVLRDQVNTWMHDLAWEPRVRAGFWTMAKLPGAQACAEKAALMTLCVLYGQGDFNYGGALSLDEVFSAEQLLYDLEIRDAAARLARGMGDAACDPERCLGEVRRGLEEGSFIGLDSTAREFRQSYWDPLLFERSALGNWRAEGERTIRDRARAALAGLAARPAWRLPDDRQRAIDDILRRARAAAGLAPELPRIGGR